MPKRAYGWRTDIVFLYRFILIEQSAKCLLDNERVETKEEDAFNKEEEKEWEEEEKKKNRILRWKLDRKSWEIRVSFLLLETKWLVCFDGLI